MGNGLWVLLWWLRFESKLFPVVSELLSRVPLWAPERFRIKDDKPDKSKGVFPAYPNR